MNALNFTSVKPSTLTCVLAMLLSVTAWGQGRSYGLALGSSHYVGDLGAKNGTAPWKATDMQASRFALTGFVEWPIEGKWQMHTALSYIRVAGDDRFADNPSRVARNLHFRSSVVEVQARGQFKFWDRPRHWNRSAGSRGYAFLGVGAFTYNPKSRIRTDANDVANPMWYGLRELKTEGQEEPYGWLALSMPMGIGFDWNLRGGWQVGMEVSWRYTTTDYLDDVSYTYGNPDQMSEIAALLSSQANAYTLALAGPDGGFIEDHTYSATNPTPRGNPNSRDGFGTVQFTLSRPDATLRTRPGSWVGRFRRLGRLR